MPSREGLKDTISDGVARKGWLERGDIINTMDLAEMKDFLNRRNPFKFRISGLRKIIKIGGIMTQHTD